MNMEYRGGEPVPNPVENSNDPESRENAVKAWMRTLDRNAKEEVFNGIKSIKAKFEGYPEATIGAIEQLIALYKQEQTKSFAHNETMPLSSIDIKQFQKVLAEFDRIADEYGHLEDKLDETVIPNAQEAGWDAKKANIGRGLSHGKHGRKTDPDYKGGSFLKDANHIDSDKFPDLM